METPQPMRLGRFCAVLSDGGRGWYRIIIELVWGDISAIFPFDSEVVDKDLFERFHVLERGKEGDVQIGPVSYTHLTLPTTPYV